MLDNTRDKRFLGEKNYICLVKQSNRPLRNNLKKEKEQNDKILALSVIKKHSRRVIWATTIVPTLGKSLKSAFFVTNIFKKEPFELTYAGTQWGKTSDPVL